MNRVASRSLIALVLVLVLVGGLLFFVGEYFAGAKDWVTFNGSPHVYTDGDLSGGTITDRDGKLLMDLSGSRTYAEGARLRKAVLHWTGDREGYVSVPMLKEYTDALLGYDTFSGVYGYGDGMGQLRLTLSASVQEAALKALGNYSGTVAVYNYKTGELICAVSTPTFDPENVPDISADAEAYEGVYMNRFTQSVYIPGSIFKIVTLAAALETIPDIESMEFTCTGEYTVGSGTVTCEHKHGRQDLKTAFANSCNGAFAQLVERVGKGNLQRYVERFGVVEPVSFDGITTAAGNFDIADAYGEALAWSGIGQYTDQINPCSFLTFMGAIASGGKGVSPYVVSRVKVGDKVTYSVETQRLDRIMSIATANTLKEYLQNNVEYKYGAKNFGGLTVCAKTGTAEVGGDKKPNAMFAGFVADEEYPFAFIVAVEDGGYGKDICVPIMSKVLAACVEAENS